jgi:hypothetical protein
MPDSAVPESKSSTDSALQEYLQDGKISRELVEKIADIVYAMLLEELRVDRERRRVNTSRNRLDRGGW